MDEAGFASTDRRPSQPPGCCKETIMNKFTVLTYPVIAVLSLLAAGAALAEDITPDNTATQVFASTKSRAQVQSELFAARADGSIKVWSTSYNPLALARSEKTRYEVRDTHAADHAAAWYGEDSGSFALARVKPVHVAAPVYAGAAGKRSAQ
jgi:hypothetical protein